MSQVGEAPAHRSRVTIVSLLSRIVDGGADVLRWSWGSPNGSFRDANAFARK
jgi:hypothetical protein